MQLVQRLAAVTPPNGPKAAGKPMLPRSARETEQWLQNRMPRALYCLRHRNTPKVFPVTYAKEFQTRNPQESQSAGQNSR